MPTRIHASCIVLAGAGEAFGAPSDWGVLLLAPSGAGKSDLALRMIAQGALLVADDRCEISVDAGAIWARAPETIAGLIEVRALGVTRLPFAPQARIRLAVSLVDGPELARMPEPTRYEPPADLRVRETLWPPMIFLTPFEASAPAKVAAAAAFFAGQEDH
jgi:serine kinase of HPr protein (carbohydrate metabolism regulator)